MKLHKRILSIAVATAIMLFTITCACVHADDVSDIGGAIATFENTFRTALAAVYEDAAESVNDSNIPAATKQNICKVLAMQDLMLRTMPSIYGFSNEPILPDSDTVTFSGTASSGLYKSENDNKTHVVTLCPPPPDGNYSTLDWTAATSDEFSLTIRFTPSNDRKVQVSGSRFNDGSYFPNYYNGYTSMGVYVFRGSLSLLSNSYFTGFSENEYRYGSDSLGFSISRENYIPTLSKNLEFQLGQVSNLGGTGVTATLPSGTVDSTQPWDYYNIYLLPEMQNNYPDVTNNFYVFPRGYQVPAPDPTEPPLFPYTQPWQNDNFVYEQTETSISVINPTATDASGSTYTETTIVEIPVTETSSSYVPVYGFNVPLLPNLETVTATLPQDTVPSTYSSSISNLWDMIKWVLDNSGLFPVFLALVSVGFVLFILKFLGG